MFSNPSTMGCRALLQSLRRFPAQHNNGHTHILRLKSHSHVNRTWNTATRLQNHAKVLSLVAPPAARPACGPLLPAHHPRRLTTQAAVRPPLGCSQRLAPQLPAPPPQLAARPTYPPQKRRWSTLQSTAAETVSEDYGVTLQDGSGRMVLVDAMPLLYKAHFAFPPDSRLRSGDGTDTTVLYVFLNMIINLLSLTPPPTHFAVVFDAAGKNFRHELYTDYKGQRPEMPAEIKAGIPQAKELLQAMGIPIFAVPGVEADDVLGTLGVRGVQEGMVVAIASPDKDFFQLLRMGLILLRPPKKQQYKGGSGTTQGDAAGAQQAQQGGQEEGRGCERRVSKFMLLPYTEADFEREWGLHASQFLDLLALAGDASDNVPGVAGIGPKTAASLLRQYHSLDSLLAQASEVPRRAGAMLRSPEGAAAARLSQQLVRIETSLDIPPLKAPLEDLRLRAPSDGGRSVFEMCRLLGMHTQQERLGRVWAGPAYH